jgi:c-di-GMP-binding flagellar brake protein YcgR
MGQLSEVDNYELADDRHRIRERLQIGSVLRDAMNRQCFVNIECERGVHLVTTILEVNTADSTFVYDWGGSESASAALKASQVIRFSMSLGGVPVSFTIHQADECEFDGRRAFESSFPEDILYIQRREYFRARAKIAMPFQCEGTLPDGQKVSLSVYDLSLGGVGLRSRDITPEIMPVGSVIRDASLNFDEYGTIKAPMKVVTCVRLGNDVKPWHHFGCAFLSLGSAEPMVQKMVFALERSTKKK